MLLVRGLHCAHVSGHFVGQRSGDNHARLAQQHGVKPGSWDCPLSAGPTDDRHCASDQETPNVTLAHFRCSTQNLLSTAGFSSRAAGRAIAVVKPSA